MFQMVDSLIYNTKEPTKISKRFMAAVETIKCLAGSKLYGTDYKYIIFTSAPVSV